MYSDAVADRDTCKNSYAPNPRGEEVEEEDSWTHVYLITIYKANIKTMDA